MLGYVDSAILRVRLVSDAETQFAKAHPELGYTCTLSELPRSDVIARLLTKDRIDNGYAFEIIGCQAGAPGNPNSTYYITARPFFRTTSFLLRSVAIVKSDAAGSVENAWPRESPSVVDVISPLHQLLPKLLAPCSDIREWPASYSHLFTEPRSHTQ